jgi:hypothetical protein
MAKVVEYTVRGTVKAEDSKTGKEVKFEFKCPVDTFETLAEACSSPFYESEGKLLEAAQADWARVVCNKARLAESAKYSTKDVSTRVIGNKIKEAMASGKLTAEQMAALAAIIGPTE